MSESREKSFLVVATPDPIELGQEFRKIPFHMTVIGWFSFPDHRRSFLDHAMSNIFRDPTLFERAKGGKKVMFGPENDIPAREILNIDDAPWIALHALIKTMGKFPPEDKFSDVFSPHITDTDNRKVGWHEKVAFSSVALFAKTAVDPIKYVEDAYQLESKGKLSD
ncbi:MAG TPA: hypothetical protein PK543_03435 [Candidatus Saccharibacteria bacterium]|nr:hypothetical protein [Candidatus Saccharibacteria bacterium]